MDIEDVNAGYARELAGHLADTFALALHDTEPGDFLRMGLSERGYTVERIPAFMERINETLHD